MSSTTNAWQTISAQDERAVRALLVSYGTAIDQRDWTRLRNCFSVDCCADYGDFGKWQSALAIVEFMKQAHAEVGPTLHRITNIEVRLDDGQIVARSYVDALLTPIQKDGPVHRGIGYYDDRLVRTADGWRIARRHFVPVLVS